MRDLRGREMSMIFQNPRAALNPIRKVGDQIEDVLRQHVQQSTVTIAARRRSRRWSRSASRARASAITPIRSNCPAACASAWSSRSALACQPQLLIADEPTTGLDVTTQKAVMDLIVELTSGAACRRS